jgi:hypothetical protein
MSTADASPTFPSDPVKAVPAAGCCGGPAPAGADACCVRDAEVKSAGGDGCGCGSTPAAARAPRPARSSCCG